MTLKKAFKSHQATISLSLKQESSIKYAPGIYAYEECNYVLEYFLTSNAFCNAHINKVQRCTIFKLVVSINDNLRFEATKVIEKYLWSLVVTKSQV